MSSSSLVVVKAGGELLLEPRSAAAFVDQLREIKKEAQLVVCHGGGPQISAAMKALGLNPVFRNGLRVTDAAAIGVTAQVLLGMINAPLTALCSSRGLRAVGLSGADDGMISVVPEDAELGYVGRIVKTDATLLRGLLAQGCTPVIAPLGVDGSGALFNINADTAAAAIAAALGAVRLLVLTNVRGLYREFGKEETFVPSLNTSQAREFLASGSAASGMIPKLQGVIDAVERGVGAACLVDGRSAGGLLRAFRGEPDCGTVITKE